jgi:heat shock protein HslJ
MRFLAASVVTLVVAALAPACTSNSSGPTSPSVAGGSTALTADALTGAWPLVSLQTAGEAEQAVPGSASYDLTFAADRASTRADCNLCNGALAIQGDTVTIGPVLACTRAACSTAAFEHAYVAVLAGDSTARINGRDLTLTSARGVLRFRR